MPASKCYTAMAIFGLMTCGSLNTIMLKVSFAVQGTDLEGHRSYFTKPWFITGVMFLAMMTALPFDRDLWRSKKSALTATLIDGSPPQSGGSKGMTWKTKVQWVAAPAVFDILATGLCSMGFLYIPASVWQLLRGAEMIFAALFAVIFLRRKLFCFHWLGVVLCVFGIIFVGLASVWGSSESDDGKKGDTSLLFLGMALALGGQVVAAAQVVAEEWLLKEVDLPGLQIIGFEGMWGALMMLAVVFPALYFLPGGDHGHLENDLDAVAMLCSSAPLMMVVAVYTFSCATYNIAGIAVTDALSSVHRVMLEAFRTSIVWVFGLVVHYCFDSSSPFGEAWTKYSWIEVAGFGFVMLGQAIYGEILQVPGLQYPDGPADAARLSSPGAMRNFASPLPRGRMDSPGA
mmetsp:Transcript_75399/g.218975  ORF Transcript_75399/g.218975 Transcript_75399/m.218975 type:complete len:402 (+) Transcript_75399:82-1287(+)